MENNTANQNASNNEVFNLREILLKYLHRWYWFLVSVVLCFGIAFFYLKTTNTQYQVQTTILLRKDASTSGLLDMSALEGMGISSSSSKEVEDEIQVLTSKSIMRNVIESLGMETEYFVQSGLKFEEMYPKIPLKLIVPFSFNDSIKNMVLLELERTDKGYEIEFSTTDISEVYLVTDLNKSFNTPAGILKLQLNSPISKGVKYKIVSHPLRNLTERYCSSVKVGAVNKKSNAITISVISENSKKAEVVLNKLTELYNQDAIIDKNMIASNTADFIEDRLKLISTELLDVEMNVESYKKENQLTDITSEADIFLRSSSEYDKKLAEIETQLNLVGYIETYVKDNRNQYNLVPANLGLEDQSLLDLMQEYNKALLERMKLMRTTNEANPVLMQMEQQLKQTRSSIITSIGSIKDGLKISKRDALGKNQQFTSKIKAVPTQERQFLEIKRQQEIKSNLYLFLLQKREENALSLASTIPSAKTVDYAFTSIIPVSPKRMIIFLLALMLGIVFPIIIIYLMDLLNNKILDKKEYQKLVRVPFLGSICLSKETNLIVVRDGKTTPIVEMFRLVRTNLQFMLTGKDSPVILITSSISGEGKTFTAINMAMSFALMKKKVVLVGLDIRNPMLGEYLNISKANGITMYLSDLHYKLSDIIMPSDLHPYLSIIPAGPVPPNPAELLMSDRLDELIADLRKEFDYIVIDTAPLGVVSDTYLLNRLADNSIYVSRQNYTPRDACNLINDIYENKRLNNMAVVLNGTDEASSYGYGYANRYMYRNAAKYTDKSVASKKLRNK